MKKLLKYSLSLLCAIMVIGLTSCTDSYDYDPAAPEDKGAFLIAKFYVYTWSGSGVRDYSAAP